MAKSDIEKAFTVFEGIAARDADLATKYINPEKYVEHNPRVADGLQGLREYVGHLSSENHDLKVARAFQDDGFVFTQEAGNILGQGVFFDIFRLEDGWIVEHWGFSSKAAAPNKSGHTQTDGPTQANSFENTEKNKSFVQGYYETIHIAGEHSKIPEYFSEGRCIRHEPGVRDGMAAFQDDLQELIKHRSIDKIKFVLGQGDFVFIAATGTVEGEPCVYIDLYRVEDGKLAERWGFPEKVPPREEWKNSNGML